MLTTILFFAIYFFTKSLKFHCKSMNFSQEKIVYLPKNFYEIFTCQK